MTKFQEIAEWDWVYSATRGGRHLHHLARLDDEARTEEEWGGTGTATCGWASDFRIPGFFSRMGMPRCANCCDKLGIKRGVGSPKNDHDLRQWVKDRLTTGRIYEEEAA